LPEACLSLKLNTVTAKRKRQLFTVILLLLGIRLWLLLPFDTVPTWTSLLPGIVPLLVACIPPFNRLFQAIVLRIRQKLQLYPSTTFFSVGIAVGGYLLLQIWPDRRAIQPLIHDEHAFLIGARILATGHLWHHAYPPDVAPFFETFYVIVDRVYMSMLFPGTALANVPAVWLHLPFWAGSTFCAAAVAAVIYQILAELFDPARAVIGVLVLLSLYMFREMSAMLMSEMPLLLASMILIWAWLKWRRKKRAVWAFLMGAAAGWATITRPLDALSFVSVLLVAVIFETRRQPRVLARTIAIGLLGCAPFAALLLTQNIGVTGRWDQTAYQYYGSEYFPAPFIGFHHVDFNNLPPGLSAPKRALIFALKPDYESHTLKNEITRWYTFRLNQLAGVTLPATLLIILFPLALASIKDIRRVAIIAAALVLMAAYLSYFAHMDHYLTAVIPAAICAILMGWESLERAWPRHRRKMATFLTLFISTVALNKIPGFGPHDSGPPTLLGLIVNQLRADLSKIPPNSVVLFPFIPGKSEVHAFPVFNDDVAWPDDAPVIRANDLGDEKNKALYAYYARIQPDRKFYRYMRDLNNDPNLLQYLGTAAELAEHK
jgi:hypothetical protein